jgi:hypothetical protein
MELSMTLLDEVVDICSSGNGDLHDPRGWHRKELKRVFKEHSMTLKEREQWFVKKFLPDCLNSDGWSMSDLDVIKRLLGIKKRIKISL